MSSLEYELSKGSSLGLDLVRGISAQIVVVGHGFAFFGVAKFLHEPNFPWMQNIAVLVFFLLSGFLIPYSVARRLRRQNEYSATEFTIDRFARIYVPFLASLCFVFAIDSLSRFIDPAAYKYSDAFNLKTFIGNVFMLQDHPAWRQLDDVNITSFGSARPFWTLAVEWWLYLLFGLVVLVMFTKKISLFGKLTLGAVLSVVPIYNLVGGRGEGLTAYWLFGTVVFVLLATDAAAGLPRRVKLWILIASILLGLLRSYEVMDAYDAVFAFLLATAMWTGIDLIADHDFSDLAARLIGITASHAYTLYLVHYSILDFIQVHGPGAGITNRWALFAIAFVSSNVIAFIIAHWAEGPWTRSVKRLLYRRFVLTSRPPLAV